VRFFPTTFSTVACNPDSEDAVDPSQVATNDCTADEICLSSGFCVLRPLERRFCMKACEEDADCRPGYECRSTGTRGAESLVDLNNPEHDEARFCAEKPDPFQA
jgi:hypothetical protein